MTLILAIFLALSFVTICHAEPSETQPSEQGWVDLIASTPDDFPKGTVSVLLSHAQTGETYTLTAHHVGSYKNSTQIPCGEYYVERVFTSEDSFIYEAFTQTESITVDADAAQVINVTVKFNEAASEFLQSPEASVPSAPVDEPLPEPVVNDPVEAPDAPVMQESEIEQAEPESPVESDPVEEPVENEGKFSFHTILSNIASGLFSALIFAGVVFICCWLYSRYKENNN